MTDEVEVEVEPAPPPSPPRRVDPVSDAALARYAKRMRPLRFIYAAVLTVITLVVLTIVVIAYQHGEISHATLTTVAKAPDKVALQQPSSTLTRAWTSNDTTALGTPYYEGTVVTHDLHTVRGRDALTGKQTWSYTRTDRAVCAAIQDSGVTVAVYQLHGNCDELTAVDTGTGARKWTRTLDKDGAEFNGPATYWVQPGNIMFVSATAIYAVAISGDEDHGNGGLDYWVFHHRGCTIDNAILGAAGALISQTCVRQDCKDSKFCGNGKQLLLRDISKGYDDNSDTNKKNPDQIKWNDLGSDLVPTSAGRVVSAREPAGGTLHLLDAKTGTSTAQLHLIGDSDAAAPSSFTSALDADLIWIGGRTYALATGQSTTRWQTDTESVPTITGLSGGTNTNLGVARIAVPTSSGVAQLDGISGQPATTFSAAAPAAGSLVYPFGTGFLVAGPGTTYYK